MTTSTGALFKPSSVLVTGGAGFIGSNFVRHLLAGDAGVKVSVLDALTYAGDWRNLEGVSEQYGSRFRFVQGDICDASAVNELFAKEAVDAVVHLAAETHVDRSIDEPLPFVRTNVLGTAVLLEQARSAWRKRTDVRFHHVSTDEVHGTLAATGRFAEGTPYNPSNPYSASKASADHLVRAWRRTYRLPVTISNSCNNYGPYQFPEKLLPLLIFRALAEQPLPIYGDGSQVRDWLYVSDHCRALEMVLRRGAPGRTYHVSAGNERTNLEFAREVCAILDELRPRPTGHSYAHLITFVEDRPGHDQRYVLDSTRIREELGWSPAVNLASGLRTTIEWYLGHLRWVSEVSKRYAGERMGRLR
jgi:dTDP-glucose 4,6-dehydratase